MKNACVILKNEKGADENAIASLFDAFRAQGYIFDEVRTLLNADTEKLRTVLTEGKKEYENLLLLADKSQLSAVKSAVSLSGVFKEDSFQGTIDGAGVFSDKIKSLLLLSFDGTETGTGYFQSVLLPYLQRKYGKKTDRTVIRSIGANEAHIRSLLAKAKLIDGGQMQYFHTRRYDEDIIEILYDENISKRLESDVLRVFAEGLGDTVYALDDTPLGEQLVRLLKLRGKKISVAESFTGGGVGRRIVSVSGASEVYFEGLNTYDELSKMKRLGVTEYTLRSYGAVSDQTAYEMAAGLIATGNCDISVATTGLAGPKTDRSMLPVGLCYIAVGTRERVFVYRYKFDGTREEITERAINYALFLAYKQLKTM